MGKQTGIRFSGGDVEISLKRDINGLLTSGLTVGEVTALNQQRILSAGRGWFAASPLTGADLTLFLLDDDTDALSREIVSQMNADGQSVKKIVINEGQIELEAGYAASSYR